jgi:hypothetical protein
MEGLPEIISNFFNSIGQNPSFGDVGFNVRFARERTCLERFMSSEALLGMGFSKRQGQCLPN